MELGGVNHGVFSPFLEFDIGTRFTMQRWSKINGTSLIGGIGLSAGINHALHRDATRFEIASGWHIHIVGLTVGGLMQVDDADIDFGVRLGIDFGIPDSVGMYIRKAYVTREDRQWLTEFGFHFPIWGKSTNKDLVRESLGY